MMRRYIWNVVVAVDQLFNALTGGDPDETLSSRLGKAERGDFGRCVQICLSPIVFLVNLMFWPFQGWGHCKNNIEEDEGGRELIFFTGKRL